MPPELAILVGLQASGKTTFYAERLAATHALVSRDLFRSNPEPSRRQARLLREALGAGRSVALDNTNPTRAERAQAIAVAREHGARVVCYFFPPDAKASIARNARRDGRARVPVVGILATLRRLEVPSAAEGFDRLYVVRALRDGGFEVAASPAGAPVAT